MDKVRFECMVDLTFVHFRENKKCLLTDITQSGLAAAFFVLMRGNS